MGGSGRPCERSEAIQGSATLTDVALPWVASPARDDGGVPLLLRRLREIPRRVVVQDRPEPALDLADIHSLAGGVILDLIALNLGDAEIMRLRVGDVDPRHRRARPHRV